MSYLTILVLIALISVWLEWKFRIHLYRSRKQAITTTLIIFIAGMLWDWYAVTQGHWRFPGPGLVGVHIGPLPLEEYLFFIIAPYFAITAYRVVTKEVR